MRVCFSDNRAALTADISSSHPSGTAGTASPPVWMVRSFVTELQMSEGKNVPFSSQTEVFQALSRAAGTQHGRVHAQMFDPN